MHWVDTVGNLPGVRRELAEGIGSLLGWRKGVRQKKTETRRKIIGGSRKACQEGREDNRRWWLKEIVYPYIPDPDGEDEGGQASSSLAVSTQLISVAKLLQSDLTTLAQREGGE
ncbi:hypothetical protein BHE74_00038169 [Ensete ventricosum]|nr:hypothetical protein BHE74_00038169 [Ensete ventricosum]